MDRNLNIELFDMVQYPFKPEKYRQYRNTFLQDITVGFNFKPSTEGKTELNAHFNDYLQSYFGVENSGDITSADCNITKKDFSLSFDFSDHSAVVRLSGKDYVRFSETVLPHVFKLRSFFNKVVKVEEIDKMGIRKLNVFNIKGNGSEPIDPMDVMQSLFSQEMMANLSADNLDEQEQTIPNMKKCVFKVADSSVTIRTALLPPSRPNDQFHHLLLDTLGELQPADGIKIEEIPEKLMDFNKMMFDCYHWCVNEGVKNVMQQEDINKQVKQ